MAASDKRTHVYLPETLPELLQLYRRKPLASIYAGGTDLLRGVTKAEFALPTEVISLQEIEELHRISRTERYLEIGAAATVARIVQIGSSILPPAFYAALHSIGPPGLFSLATLGGNICSVDHVYSIAPLLSIMDVRYEVRRQGNSRWVPASRFRDTNGAPALAEGEILTRIRLPLEHWNVQVFRQLGTIHLASTSPLIFCALGKTTKAVLDDFRLTFCGSSPILYRNRELEAELVGRKLPLPAREIDAFLHGVGQGIERTQMPLTPLQLHRATGLTRMLLARMGQPHLID